jgi:hypothetical protein
LQAQELQSNRDYEQALYLCDVVENTRQAVEKWRVNSIHLDYGFYLFTKGDFDRSMEHFSLNADADPRIVLSLYPDLLPSTPASASFRNFQIPSSTLEEKQKIDAMMKDPQIRTQSLNALIQFLSCRRMPATATNLSQTELEIAEAVDTALLKSLLYSNDEFVTGFLESHNRCHIGDSERVLSEHKKYTELVLFYKTKSLHEKALLLLKSLGDGKGEIFTDLAGVEPTIK